MIRDEQELWEDIHRANDTTQAKMVFDKLCDDLRAKYISSILSNKPEAMNLRDHNIAAVNVLDELRNEFEKIINAGITARDQLNKGTNG